MLLYDNHKKRYLVISDLVGTNWSASSDVTTIGKIEEANYSGDEWPEKFTPLNNMKECNVIHTGFSGIIVTHMSIGSFLFLKRIVTIIIKNL